MCNTLVSRPSSYCYLVQLSDDLLIILGVSGQLSHVLLLLLPLGVLVLLQAGQSR